MKAYVEMYKIKTNIHGNVYLNVDQENTMVEIGHVNCLKQNTRLYVVEIY